MFLLIISLGSALVFLLCFKSVVCPAEKEKRNGVLFQLYLFLLIFFILQFGQSFVHNLFYSAGKKHSGLHDIMTRYLLPFSSLLMLGSFVIVKDSLAGFRSIVQHKKPIMCLLSIFCLICLCFFRIHGPNRYDFYFINEMLGVLHLPGNALAYISIIFPVLFYFIWLRGRLNTGLVLGVSVLLFFSSFVTFSIQRTHESNRIQNKGYNIRNRMYDHEIFARRDIRRIYLLSPDLAFEQAFPQLLADVKSDSVQECSGSVKRKRPKGIREADL